MPKELGSMIVASTIFILGGLGIILIVLSLLGVI